MPFNPAGASPYAGRDLRYYYQSLDGVPVSHRGRSAGYCLRPAELAVGVHLTESVFDELFGPPILGTPARQRWEAKVRDRDMDLP